MKNRQSEIIVFAGPNGSGKSTYTNVLLPPGMVYINADEIKKNMKCTDLEAAQLAEKQREDYILQGKDFAFETVMSTERNLILLQKAKSQGYFIRCYYILTSKASINVSRVKARVAAGGHDVPTLKIRERYARALGLIQAVVDVSDICHVYDNSGLNAFRFYKKRKNETYYDDTGIWSFDRINHIISLKDSSFRMLN